MAKKKTFEDSFNKLEEITETISQQNIPLEKSIELYKKGIDEILFCSKFLKNAQDEVFLLQQTVNDSFKLSKFKDTEEF